MLTTNYNKKMLQQANKFYQENNFVQLGNFLTEKSLKTLKKLIKEIKTNKDYCADERNRKFGIIESDKQIKYIKKIVEIVLNKKINLVSTSLQIFSKGDYTLLKDCEENNSEGKIFCIDITSNWDNKFGGGDHLFINNEELILSVMPNSIWIAKKLEKQYIKYINCLAENKKRIIIKGKFL